MCWLFTQSKAWCSIMFKNLFTLESTSNDNLISSWRQIKKNENKVTLNYLWHELTWLNNSTQSKIKTWKWKRNINTLSLFSFFPCFISKGCRNLTCMKIHHRCLKKKKKSHLYSSFGAGQNVNLLPIPQGLLLRVTPEKSKTDPACWDRSPLVLHLLFFLKQCKYHLLDQMSYQL